MLAAITDMIQQPEQHSTPLGVAGEVQDFYERYPYPRPVDSLENYRQLWQDDQRRRADYHLFWPAGRYREDRSILVAGCGTSQAAKHAMRWPEAQVTGIDFSATSVRCTEELKRKYGLHNLQVHQIPVEHVYELDAVFDRIVCTGVLHHLADPEAGLRALRDVLEPDGALNLMVYAPYGRAGIYMMQEFCRRVGIQATDGGIRDLIGVLGALSSGHPLASLLREAPDFRQEAALADALLHPRDRAYSVPQLFDLIERAGLTFGRWVRQAPYSSRCGAPASIPLASRMVQLPLAGQYAAVELFRGTMVRHSMIAYRNDGPEPHPVSFAGDAWLGYVPIRVSGTVCVEKRLPPGAAAVLINPNHTFRDLVMAIDSAEKCWLEAIDGTRPVSEIIARTAQASHSGSELERAHAFFERLWWYDQVVFDVAMREAVKPT